MIDGRFTVPMRLVVQNHPPGVAITMQKGSDEQHFASERRGDDVVFDFEVAVDGALADGRPRFLGPFTQGPPQGRFVYTRIGAAAGDPHSPWSRRAKIYLAGVDWAALQALQPGQRLQASYQGADKKGEPTCASVKTLSAWTPV